MAKEREMSIDSIRGLFASDIGREIEEVIKVDQTDAGVIRSEIGEYVVTDALQNHFREILERYSQTPLSKSEKIAVWVSGFFGSGKSSFAKMLGLSLSDAKLDGDSAAGLLASRMSDKAVQVLLHTVSEKIPTHAVIFDVSTDRGIRTGSQTLTQIMYTLFLQSLGYARDLDLSELEIALEKDGRLESFKSEYSRLYGKEWDEAKGQTAFSLQQASAVMHSLDPVTYPTADSWVTAAKDKADITPAKLGERASELMDRRRPGSVLLFVIDEVGQFVARDVQKMLDLQAIVQSLGVKGRGRHWIVVTSQERLGELVSGLDDKRVELARLTDRFSTQVHLESTDIAEVTSRRVLAKNAAAQETLGRLYDDCRGRLCQYARLTADIQLTDLSRDGFIELYPLLPYQIELIIQIVSGLRTQGGASRHMGGANRTVIKLAQQLLVGKATGLADMTVGSLARLDHIYDLVENNISTELRAKIDEIPAHGLSLTARQVAKAICLLQFAKSVHRTAENISASLFPSVDADSCLPAVKEAIAALEGARVIRSGEDGYRIQTPAEDDWERRRMSYNPAPGDVHRIQSDAILGFWQPQPDFRLLGIKAFRAGLSIDGRNVQSGDMNFQLFLDDAGRHATRSSELRQRSQQEGSEVFWAVALDEGIETETVEVFRSRRMLEEKEREARTATETGLVAEEKHRLKKHMDELRRRMRRACLEGGIFFRGNERGPGDRTLDVGACAAEVMSSALPDVFSRFGEAAVKPADAKKGLDTLLTAENLRGLPQVFADLRLLRDEKGQPVFRVEATPLSEIMSRISDRARYGEKPSGRFITEEMAREPFGWDFDTVRFLVACLLRAGAIEATSKGQILSSALATEAREAFSNNNLFRQMSFQPHVGIGAEEVIKAGEAFRSTFGREARELSESSLAAEIRSEVAGHEDIVASSLMLLREHHLPGLEILESCQGEMKTIRRGGDEAVITTFNASHRTIREGIQRATELEQVLTVTRLSDLDRARSVAETRIPILLGEPDLSEGLRKAAAELLDLLERELFFRELALIDQHARDLEDEYGRRHSVALEACRNAYQAALGVLAAQDGWAGIDDEQKERISAELRRGAAIDQAIPIPQLRSELAACQSRLRSAIDELLRLVAGERLARIDIGSFFASGVETMEQLEEALKGIREECSRLIGAGKRVIPR